MIENMFASIIKILTDKLVIHYGHNFTERIISKLMSLYDIYTTDKWADRTISTET
jgi:hypothetical protein